MKPMLSGTINASNIDKLRFPLVVSPKFDGIRLIIHPEKGPVTRSLEPIRNRKLKEILSEPELSYIDGEIIYGDCLAKDVFQKTTSNVMSFEGEIDEMVFYVFDYFKNPDDPFHKRFSDLVNLLNDLTLEISINIVCHPPVESLDELNIIENRYVEVGYEGIMVRNPNGKYKFGRSTINEQYLLKLKRLEDAEATIIGYKALKINNNVSTINELGYKEKSLMSENLVEVDKIGAFSVKCDGFEKSFEIGTGLTDAQRTEYWINRESLIGKTITFTYQASGIKDSPRFPSFKGFRKD